MEEKSLAEHMAEEADRLDAEEEVTAPIGTGESSGQPEEEPENAAEIIDEIEKYLIDEGQWLEGQIAAEVAYKNCPLCAMMPDAFSTLAGAVKDSLELADDLREQGTKDSIIAALLMRDRAWYECSKAILLRMFEEGHQPRNVINAHPELRSLAHRKKISKTSNSKRKQKRKAARNARRRHR